MNLILKWLVRIFAILAGVSVLAAGLAWYLVTRSLPDYQGEIALPGLDGPVTIIRDANAVPHIRAGTEHDAFVALGLVQAQDRLWQMELSRRAAQGRLSELLGAQTIELDRLVKTLDLYGHARRSFAFQDPATKDALEAHAAGVNAWIRHVAVEALGRGAPEFFVFGAELSPWTPADSLAILKMMALRLSAAAHSEVLRAQALLALPPERVADLLPDYPVAAKTAPRRPTVVLPGADRALAPVDPVDPMLAVLGMPVAPELAGASNIWAVDGTRTATGKPLMANDPHLWLSAPSIWYLASIEAPGMSVIGGMLPGTPVVLVGRNRSLGWGLTTANVDDQDLYIEEVNPANSREYRLPDGSWAPFGTRSIRIEISDQPAETGTVRTTRHGPVMTGSQFGADVITPEGYVTALAWTALTDEDRTMSAAMKMMHADSIDAGVATIAGALAPAQNVALVDETGVAMVLAGAIPRRSPESASRGRIPSIGSNAANDWTGLLPEHENPRVIRPAGGAVANANNRVTDAQFPNHVSFDWARPYRIERISKELSARAFHSRDGFVALQGDTISEMARSILPLIARDLWWKEGTLAEGDEQRRRALELLAEWNGDMDQYKPEPLIFQEWVRALTRRLAADELGTLYGAFEGPRPLFVERVYRDIDGAAIWCDINKTPEVEDCATAASLALDDALARLTREYGNAVEGWRWGAEHVALHRHTPFGYIQPFALLVNIEQETSGGNHTLLRGQTPGYGGKPFQNVHAAGLRVVYDFADLDRSLMVIATGQSGHPFSRWYDNLSEIWLRGEMIPMSMAETDIRAGAIGEMTLTPEDAR